MFVEEPVSFPSSAFCFPLSYRFVLCFKMRSLTDHSSMTFPDWMEALSCHSTMLLI